MRQDNKFQIYPGPVGPPQKPGLRAFEHHEPFLFTGRAAGNLSSYGCRGARALKQKAYTEPQKVGTWIWNDW